MFCKQLLMFILAINAIGCSVNNKTTPAAIQTQISTNLPPKTIPNDKCEDVKKMKIFQVLDNVALAWVCDGENDSVCLSYVVAIPSEKGKYFYDDQIIKAPSGKCISYYGVYKYTTNKDKLKKTVPVAKMIDAYIPNPEYVTLQRSEEKYVK